MSFIGGGSIVLPGDCETAIALAGNCSTPIVMTEAHQPSVVVTMAIPGPPGAPGPIGPSGAATLIETAVPISGHSAVACNASGLLIPADCTLLAHRGAVLGVTDSAYAAGAGAEVKTEFMLEHAGWAWAPGPVFVGVAGALTQTLPPGAVFSQVVGQALAATQLLVDLQPPITLS